MIKKQKRVAMYLRVSKDESTTENQRRDLERAAEFHGWQIVATFEDEGISGAKGRDKRPEFDTLMKGVARKEYDMIAAWAVDRLGRNLEHLVGFINELRAKGIDLYLHQQALDTSTPSGRAMFQMCGVFAEFELGMTGERIRAGLARAKAEHKRKTGKDLKLGRPSAMTPAKERKARELLAKRVGVLKIGKQLGVGTGTIQNIKRAMQTAA